MKALTIWQPWASLIMAGAKPYEFREWDYRRRYPGVEGERIVIHAGARPMRKAEIEDIFERLEDPLPSALDSEIALPLLRLVQEKPGRLPLASGLGTAIIGKPRRATALFRGQVADSDRIDMHIWAWPLTDIQPFEPIVPARGWQGFWNWEKQV